jgi:hypothetical protein
MRDLGENKMFSREEFGLENGMSWSFRALILGMIGVVSFGAGLFYAMNASAAQNRSRPRARTQQVKRAPRVVYPKKTEVDFEGLSITGELRNPGDFYFQRKTDEKFDSLVKRRKNFHREMLRDVVMAK